MYVTLHRSIISSGAGSRVLSNIPRGNDALLPVGQILITAEACRIRKQKLGSTRCLHGNISSDSLDHSKSLASRRVAP
jgi:hypothetical protein